MQAMTAQSRAVGAAVAPPMRSAPHTAACVPQRRACLGTIHRPHVQPRMVVRMARLFDDDDDDDFSAEGDFGSTDYGDDLKPVGSEYLREWPNKLFIEETLEAFPDKGVCDVEEARCLYSNGGYTYLDVRPALEFEEIGKVRNSVNVPMGISKRRYDPEQKKRVVEKSNNPNFIKDVEKRFPKKDVKLIVGCSDGKAYSMDALEALDEAGYENIVGLRGGYYKWFSVFTNKLERRRTGEYAEQFTHDGDSSGIHSSGAGFENQDKIEKWVPAGY